MREDEVESRFTLVGFILFPEIILPRSVNKIDVKSKFLTELF